MATNNAIWGWVTLTNALTTAVTTNSKVVWVKKSGGTSYTSGFKNEFVVVGSVYNSSISNLLALQSANLILAGGGLSAPITNTITISTNTITVTGNPSNGPC